MIGATMWETVTALPWMAKLGPPSLELALVSSGPLASENKETRNIVTFTAS